MNQGHLCFTSEIFRDPFLYACLIILYNIYLIYQNYNKRKWAIYLKLVKLIQFQTAAESFRTERKYA